MGCPSSAASISAFIVLLGLLALPIIEPVSGAIECEELPVEDCAFAVSSSGARCVLETDVQNNAAPEYKCQTSIIMAERPMEWIETEECINTCGLQRLSVGLSTDALLERDFTRKLCFSECRSKCPNINDLYTKLAAEEGIYLPSLCDSLKPRGARKLISAHPHARLKKQQQRQRQQLEASTQKASVHREVNMQSEMVVAAWAPATSPSPASGGWPIAAPPAAPPNVAEEPYPWAEPPAYDDSEPHFYDDAEPPYYDDTDELPPSPSYEEEAPSPAPLAALPPLFFSVPPVYLLPPNPSY